MFPWWPPLWGTNHALLTSLWSASQTPAVITQQRFNPLRWKEFLFTWDLVWKQSSSLGSAVAHPVFYDWRRPSLTTQGCCCYDHFMPNGWQPVLFCGLESKSSNVGAWLPIFPGKLFFSYPHKRWPEYSKQSHIWSRIGGGAGKQPISEWLSVRYPDGSNYLTLQSLCPLRFTEDQLKFLSHFVRNQHHSQHPLLFSVALNFSSHLRL